jgi:GGDEF domain-containing protein
MDHEASAEAIMISADAAMYQAKQNGRNLICFNANTDA